MTADANLTVARLQPEELDELEPLWTALLEHHGSVAPHLRPLREPGESWAFRRGVYQAWLAEPENFAVVARRDGQAVGYAMVAIHGPTATLPAERSGCLETLSVLPSARGHGVGSLLITAARAGLAELGIADMTIEVIVGNDDALRFYARHGFGPFVHTLRGTTGLTEPTTQA